MSSTIPWLTPIVASINFFLRDVAGSGSTPEPRASFQGSSSKPKPLYLFFLLFFFLRLFSPLLTTSLHTFSFFPLLFVPRSSLSLSPFSLFQGWILWSTNFCIGLHRFWGFVFKSYYWLNRVNFFFFYILLRDLMFFLLTNNNIFSLLFFFLGVFEGF